MSSLMWYQQPATEWKQGLPIGNGVLAAMVIGGVECDRVALNHEWLWRAKGRKRDVEEKWQWLDEIRRLFFEGKTLEAGNLANEKLGGLGGVSRIRNRVDPYQPAGDLTLAFPHKSVSNYRRQLDLEQALVSVAYEADGKSFLREYLAPLFSKAIAIRLSAGGEAFDTTIGLSRIADPECDISSWAKTDSLGFMGRFVEGSVFAVEVRLVLDGGQARVPTWDKAEVAVEGTREVLILVTIAVDHDGGDPRGVCRKQFEGVPGSWNKLLAAHIRKHRSYYNRVKLSLGKCRDDMPTDKRLAEVRAGGEDESLYALFFNFGRYLLIASSIGAELPANLQGKWNEELAPPWECDIHQDINVQMNYWPAESCALPESVQPLFRHFERFVPHAREAAKKLYNCEGVWFPIQTDPWGRATPEARGWDVWTGAAAWLAQHFWWHYEYTLDKEFLAKRAYPVFKEVAAFYETYLVRDPEGRLVTVPSQSPENCFVGGSSPVSLCIGATMDFELVYDLLTHAIQASEILGVDADKREKWRQILADIPPLQIGKHGQLQEWLEDYDETEPGHRHISHLFGFYPGDQITPEETPELTAAVRVSLERRLAHGGGHTGWSASWLCCCYARLREGDRAVEYLKHVLKHFATDSLLDLHPPRIFQIDGNFGCTAGIAEMLLQSHKGIIRILPALPSAWRDGAVAGLRARGGFEIGIVWKDARPRKITVRSTVGGPCRLRLPQPARPTLTAVGQYVLRKLQPADEVRWDTEAGARYTVSLR